MVNDQGELLSPDEIKPVDLSAPQSNCPQELVEMDCWNDIIGLWGNDES